jgi:hypothetical protein
MHMERRDRAPGRTIPRTVLFAALAACAATPAFAQNSPALYDREGKYLGNLNANRYDPNSVSNPYGRYGSPYSADSINNPHGRYGSPYSSESVNNPYGQGLNICAPGGPC